MHILLLGGGGFIGQAILAELVGAGHRVSVVARRAGGLRAAWPDVAFHEIDLARALDPADWAPALAVPVDAVVNAAGVLRGPEMEAVHVNAPRALHAAALAAGVRRVVLISAVSARPDVPTDYARSKLEGEEALRGSGLEWTILRPSLVYAEGSYGGTSLLRALAAMPLAVPLAGNGGFGFSPIHAADLARTVRLCCEEPRHANAVLEPSGPDDLTLRELLGRYRQWLGFGEARFVRVPLPVMRLLGRVGDLFGSGPVSTNSLVQMEAGNEADGAAFARAVGFAPRRLDDALRTHPAQVQDRWHARLFFLAPALKAVLVLLWLASAALGLFAGTEWTARFVAAAGLSEALAAPLRIGSSVLDLAIAMLLLVDRRPRWSVPIQLGTVLGYTVGLGLVLPGLWLDPLGPLLKNLPILLVILVHGVIGDSR